VPRRAHIRASDEDRERVAELLRRAAAEGRLLTHELEHRLAAALRARTYGELDPLVADLPRGRQVDRRGGSSLVRLMRPAVALVIAIPLAVALVTAVVFVLTSLFAVWMACAAIAWWMFGRRVRHPPWHLMHPRAYRYRGYRGFHRV
jgi:hypothetical protein